MQDILEVFFHKVKEQDKNLQEEKKCYTHVSTISCEKENLALQAPRGPSHTQLGERGDAVLNLMFILMCFKLFLPHSLVPLSNKLVLHFLLY